MTDSKEAQLRLAERKRLVFANLINGVPAPVVGQNFHLAAAEVEREFADVLLKIKAYMRDRNIVGFEQLHSVADAKRDRLVVLHVLERLGPVFLSSPPKYRAIRTEAFDQDFLRREFPSGGQLRGKAA